MLKKATTASGQRSARGTLRLCPLPRTRRSSPPPPTRRQIVRNIHGSSSRSASFIAGQLPPQRRVRATRRRTPPSDRGRARASGHFRQLVGTRAELFRSQSLTLVVPL